MHIHRARLPFLFLISMSAYICSQAQDVSSERNSLKEGAWALQFGIASNFTLTSFQGTTISVKYQLSEKNAIRGGITINGSANNGNTSTSGSVSDTSYGTVPENSSSDVANVSFVLQYLWYINPHGPVHFYVGLGPSVSYNYSYSSSDNSSLYTTSNNQGYWYRTTNWSDFHQWTTAGTGVGGVEWFATQWLSLRAEYNEGIQYQWSTTSTQNYSTGLLHENSGTTKGWALSSSGVSFGLSVYW